MATARALGVLLVLGAGSVAPALAASPSPVPGTPPTPRCHVVHGPRATQHAPTSGSVSLYIPRVSCTSPGLHTPPPRPVQGGASGGASGQVPFTGDELRLWSALGFAAAGAGALLVAVGRHRRVSR